MSSEVSTVCEKCGASLDAKDAFCTSCGAYRSSSTQPSVSQRFCTKCGSLMFAEAKFCEKCGAPVSQPAAIQVPYPTPVAPDRRKSSRFVMIAVAVFMVFLIFLMGSCAYIAYRAKQKANAIEEAYKHD